MIRLTKSPTVPSTLQSETVRNEKQKLAENVANGNNPKSEDFKSELYGAQDVREILAKDQYGKCIFCESTLLNQDGGEVEHYRPKTAVRQDETPRNTRKPAYYQLAYDWENLSACCHACNRRKGTFFPLEDDSTRFELAAEVPLIINPYREDPSFHIEFRSHKMYAKVNSDGNIDKKGEQSIKYLGLNRGDLIELRRRHLSKFRKTMKRLGLTFDEMLELVKQDNIEDDISPESIEFLGMYENQVLKEL